MPEKTIITHSPWRMQGVAQNNGNPNPYEQETCRMNDVYIP